MSDSQRNSGEKPKKVPSAEAMLLKMATLCARSEQCPSDIRKKLIARGLGAADCNRIIADLTERKFLSEERFARSFARDKVRFSAWGKIKIRKALYAKRIPASVIEEALSQIPAEDYSSAIIRAARSKAAGLQLANPSDRMKLYKFLLGRGFESYLAARLIDRAVANLKST